MCAVPNEASPRFGTPHVMPRSAHHNFLGHPAKTKHTLEYEQLPHIKECKTHPDNKASILHAFCRRFWQSAGPKRRGRGQRKIRNIRHVAEYSKCLNSIWIYTTSSRPHVSDTLSLSVQALLHRCELGVRCFSTHLWGLGSAVASFSSGVRCVSTHTSHLLIGITSELKLATALPITSQQV